MRTQLHHAAQLLQARHGGWPQAAVPRGRLPRPAGPRPTLHKPAQPVAFSACRWLLFRVKKSIENFEGVSKFSSNFGLVNLPKIVIAKGLGKAGCFRTGRGRQGVIAKGLGKAGCFRTGRGRQGDAHSAARRTATIFGRGCHVATGSRHCFRPACRGGVMAFLVVPLRPRCGLRGARPAGAHHFADTPAGDST